MLELVVAAPEGERVYPLDREEIVIGRSPQAHITIDNHVISRQHVRILRRGDEITIQDLQSRNGTKVNDQPVMAAKLKAGDRILLGNILLTLRRRGEPERAVEIDDSKEISAEGTVVRSNLEVDELLRAELEQEQTTRRGVDLAKSHRVLRVLTSVARALISEDKLDGILRRVLDLVFENVPAARGVLAVFEDGNLVPRIVRQRKGSDDGRIVIPRAIAERVRAEKVSLLTVDASRDQRFDSSASVLALGMRSAICVPLFERDQVIGIIYVDSDVRGSTFSPADLDLVAALANYAAVAIERARLTERVRQEQETRAKLERYHSPGVIERILSSGADDALEMHERRVSVMFTDVVGFTTLSEGLRPRQVGQIINELFTELTECIFTYEGTLDKYIGDCIMAVFGAPMTQEDNALRCVRAALEMHRALAAMNREDSGGIQLQLRTGINTGNVVAGDIGSPKRKDYSVLGDTVNQAARLEAYVAKPGQVVIGDATYEEVKGYFKCESLGTFSLKGKKKEVAAYRVVGER
jgi:adenylate cyclase